MKIINKACIKRAGEFYEIMFITNNDQQFLDEGVNFINIKSNAAEIVKEELERGNIVFIKSEIIIEITINDLIVNVPDEIEQKRIKLLHKARNIVTMAAATLRGFDFFEFILANNYFNRTIFLIC